MNKLFLFVGGVVIVFWLVIDIGFIFFEVFGIVAGGVVIFVGGWVFGVVVLVFFEFLVVGAGVCFFAGFFLVVFVFCFWFVMMFWFSSLKKIWVFNKFYNIFINICKVFVKLGVDIFLFDMNVVICVY